MMSIGNIDKTVENKKEGLGSSLKPFTVYGVNCPCSSAVSLDGMAKNPPCCLKQLYSMTAVLTLPGLNGLFSSCIPWCNRHPKGERERWGGARPTALGEQAGSVAVSRLHSVKVVSSRSIIFHEGWRTLGGRAVQTAAVYFTHCGTVP